MERRIGKIGNSKEYYVKVFIGLFLLVLLFLSGCSSDLFNKNPTYTVTYSGNGNDSGSVPSDSTNYEEGQTVTVLDNTGNLIKTSYIFAGWNTQADGNGTTYTTQDNTFTMGSSNVTLYAKWTRSIYAGGIIFFVDSTGEHGLVAALSDQSTGVEWGGDGTTVGGTSTGIGAGAANTKAIVAALGDNGGTPYAAKICADLVLNGYDDWFLPSKDEINLMYQNLKTAGLGGFADEYYWSSSEYNSNGAWRQYFDDGDQNYRRKNSDKRVRAVRAF